ncbi:MAG TPA: hypothetical protein EYN67_15220 [Flavobacteriales bacterium]|nr:hypothetical protein [Flavobacteriales bacterium]
MIKTFRGLIGDDAQDTINLHTNDGKTGYRIVKLSVIGIDPRTVNAEQMLKIYKVDQGGTQTSTVDFSDQTLLGCAYYESENTASTTEGITIIFDREIFNQDIYITNYGSSSMNYYLELEQISLDLNESTVATLQSIRNA